MYILAKETLIMTELCTAAICFLRNTSRVYQILFETAEVQEIFSSPLTLKQYQVLMNRNTKFYKQNESFISVK